jgi:small subunit ribosomal protein S1
MVVEKEDREGHLHLSRKLARITRAWERIVEIHKTGEIVTGVVTSKTKGGLIVDVFGMETFLPGSQIDVKPVTDYDQFVGKTMEFKVVKINENIKNAVVSHKALIESDIEQQRAVIMSKLEKGQVLEEPLRTSPTSEHSWISVAWMDYFTLPISAGDVSTTLQKY